MAYRETRGQPPKFEDVQELQERIDKYFEECDLKGTPYTMSGLALSLDCDRKTILNYSKDEKFFHTIKKARDRVERYVEESLMSNKNTAGVIFNLKNNFGWVDKQEVEQHTTFDFGSATLKDAD